MRISTLVIFWWLHLLGTDYYRPGNMMRWHGNHHLEKNAWTFFHLTKHLPWQNTLQGFQPLATQWVKRAGTSHLGFFAPQLVTSLTTENHLLEHFWVHDFLTSSSVGLSTTLSCTNFTSCEYAIRLFLLKHLSNLIHVYTAIDNLSRKILHYLLLHDQGMHVYAWLLSETLHFTF